MSGFGWFFDPEAMRHQMQIKGMEQTAEALGRQRVLFEELSYEHLVVFHQLLGEVTQAPHELIPLAAHQLYGLVTGVMASRQHFRNEGAEFPIPEESDDDADE